jgi:fructokinase
VTRSGAGAEGPAGDPTPTTRPASSELAPSPDVLCVGEVVWDALPDGLFLGGAPLNVACHLHALGAPVGVASRVGADRLGEEAVRRIRDRGLSTDLVQVDGELPTGFVEVTLEREDLPRYRIVEPAAWDRIRMTDTLWRRAATARAVVFGSLAQRSTISRETIRQVCETRGLKVFDVNLRAPHDDEDVVRASLQQADVVKLNDGELGRMQDWFGLPRSLRSAAEALAGAFGLRAVCVTRGAAGAALWRDGRWTEHSGFPVEVRDTVGAGDAFLATLLTGILAGHDDRQVLERGNRLGAYVATQPGAVPEYREDVLAAIGKPGPTPHRVVGPRKR